MDAEEQSYKIWWGTATGIIFIFLSIAVSFVAFFPELDQLFSPPPEIIEITHWIVFFLIIIIGGTIIVGVTAAIIIFLLASSDSSKEEEDGKGAAVVVGIIGLAILGSFIAAVIAMLPLIHNFAYELITVIINPAYGYSHGFLFNDLLQSNEESDHYLVLAIYVIVGIGFLIGMYILSAHSMMICYSTSSDAKSLKRNLSFLTTFSVGFSFVVSIIGAGAIIFKFDTPLQLLKLYAFDYLLNTPLADTVILLKESIVWPFIDERTIIILISIWRALKLFSVMSFDGAKLHDRYNVIIEVYMREAGEGEHIKAIMLAVIIFTFYTMNEIIILVFCVLTIIAILDGLFLRWGSDSEEEEYDLDQLFEESDFRFEQNNS